MTTRASSATDGAPARLAAGVAHELRNPLAVILARAQLLLLSLRAGRMPDADKLERTLRTIEEQAVRASQVIESLSAFARPREPDAKPFDFADMLEQVFAGVQAAHPAWHALRTEVTVDPAAATIVADREQLATALHKLIVNACEAMGGDGGILHILAVADAAGIAIHVIDEGPGVPARDAERIFEPFFSTKPGAAGLGLPVAQTIAEAHEGTLRLVAGRGAGAEFVLGLPHPRSAA